LFFLVELDGIEPTTS